MNSYVSPHGRTSLIWPILTDQEISWENAIIPQEISSNLISCFPARKCATVIRIDLFKSFYQNRKIFGEYDVILKCLSNSCQCQLLLHKQSLFVLFEYSKL